MMKKVLIFIGVVVVLAAAVLGFAVYRANDLIAKYKPQLENALGNAVGTQVSLGELDVSVIPTTKVVAKKVILKEKGDPGPGLGLDNLSLSVELSRLIFGELVVSTLELDSPHITVVKTADGVVIQGLPKKAKGEPNERTGARQPNDSAPSEGKKSISINANNIAVKDATITLQGFTPQGDYRIHDLDIHASLAIDGQTINIPKWDVQAVIPGDAKVVIIGTTTALKQAENVLDVGTVKIALPSGSLTINGSAGLGGKKGSISIGGSDINAVKLAPLAAPFVTNIDTFLPLMPVVKSLKGALDMATDTFVLENATLGFKGGDIVSSGEIVLASQSGALLVSGNEFDLSTVGEMLANQAPMIAQYKLVGTASPKLDVSLNPAGPTIKGPIELKGIGATVAGTRPMTLSGGNGTLKADVTTGGTTIETKDFAISFNGHPLVASTTVHQRPTGIDMPALDVKGFGGTMGVTFKMGLEGAKDFATTLDLRSLDVSQLLSLVDATKAETISGTLSSFKGRLSGNLNPGGPQTWNGSGTFELTKGLLKDINIAGAVLQKVDNLPVVTGALSAQVPERFRPVVSSKDTTIQRMSGGFDVVRGLATVKNFVLDSDHFSLQGDGTYSLTSSSVDLTTTIFFSKEFSAALVASAKELRNILDATERLVIPLALKGTPPGLTVLPNTAKLLEVGAKGVIRSQAGDALEKTIDKKLGAGAGKDVRKTLENLLNF